jgi:hypothetical protein
MGSPAVSIVMAVFNGEAFLAEAVESILGQTLRDFEFVIVDDGSTDGTSGILSDYAKRDPRVRVFTQQNKGRADSLNFGINLARSDLIARMDADDISLPHRLKDQREFMDGHNEVGLLGGTVEFIGPERQKLGVFKSPEEDRELRAGMRRCNQFYHPTVMMRKEVVLAAGGYRRALRDADDYDLFLRIAERARMASLAKPVLLYRIHANQTSVLRMTHQALCVLAARVAASLRSRGSADPLSGIEEVTPELVRNMGASAEEIRREAVNEHAFWLPLLAEVNTDGGLQLIDNLLQLCYSGLGAPERIAAAGALLKAASIHFKQRRFTKALASGGRGLFVQPLETGRIIKMAIARRARSLNARVDTP